MKLWPLIIIIVKELRLKEEGQHFIIQQNELHSLVYFTITIQVVIKKSHKEQIKKVRSIKLHSIFSHCCWLEVHVK
jgi:hypothetical protein